MRKVKLYIAISLNGKIARPDGSVDWLDAIPNPDKTDYGYSDFYNGLDITIQGFNTYQKVLDWGVEMPYKGTKNYVFTRKQNLEPAKQVEFISSNHIEFVKELKAQKGKDIWLIGGGQLNTLFFNENLIDEILLFIMPVIIPEGIELFGFIPQEKQLTLLESKSYDSGVVELKYSLSN